MVIPPETTDYSKGKPVSSPGTVTRNLSSVPVFPAVYSEVFVPCDICRREYEIFSLIITELQAVELLHGRGR